MRYFLFFCIAIVSLWPSAHASELLLPPDSKVASQTREDLTIEWWQWAFAGNTQEAKKSGKRSDCAPSASDEAIWFLAGFTKPENGKVRLSCTIPEGKYLFLRVAVLLGTARESETQACNSKGTSIDDLDAINQLSVEIDGRKIDNVADYRVKISKCFNPYADRAQEKRSGKKTAASNVAATSDGYWLPLAPLAKGRHIVKIHGTAQFDKSEPPEDSDEEFEVIIE